MTMNRILGHLAEKAFEGRGISPETVVRFGIFTASRDEAGDVLPDPNGDIVVFPFYEHGVEVATKYRGRGKKFWQRTGGRRTFWNSDVLDDPALEAGTYPLIITEGEIDSLTAIDCGFPFCVSVPDGAPPALSKEPDEKKTDTDLAQDQTGKFEFLWNNRDRLKRIKRFILAVDNDPPGQRLAAELVRRLSASKCLFVTYPEGCKDLNDVLKKEGRDSVAAVLNGARPYPVHGLYRLKDYPDIEAVETFSTGWITLDQHLRLFVGEFMVVTGVPSHGKSSLIIHMLVNLAEQYRWRSAIFSPEMPTVPHLRDKMRRIRLRDELERMPLDRIADADAWLNDYFVFIDCDPTGGEEDDFDLDTILQRAKDAVLRDGIKVLLIDPWNEVEHAKRPDESVTDYVARGIRALKRFGREHQVVVIVIAHPTKDVSGKDGKVRKPTLYDIESSAAWANKSDHGLVVSRENDDNEAVVSVVKVRFDGTGSRGYVTMAFDRYSGRFELLDYLRSRV